MAARAVFPPTQEELLARLNWFVKLRWLFLLALGGVLFFALQVFGVGIDRLPFLLIGGTVVVYNLLFFFLHRSRRRTPERVITFRDLRIEANLQIGLDLLCLVFLVHYSGGIENPFIFFFVFHMILGSILLTGRDIWYQAIGAMAILVLLLVLSYFRVIRHYHLPGFATDQLWTNVPYLWAGAVSFLATIFMTVYMTNSISRSVRRREEELFLTKTQLERKSAELELANRELIKRQNLLVQTEKLASLGKLSAGIAHELNSPLTGILHFSHFVKEACPDQDQVQQDIDVVLRETKRCKKIIKGLLDFARQSQPEKNQQDIVQVLNKTLSLIENHKDFRSVEIRRNVPENLPAIMFDTDQIQQVFMNLIVNAQEAMPSGGTLYIDAGLNGDYIEIRFKDTGLGISEQNLQRIFDPFFTTKEKGTGLGLSVSMGIIQNHAGKLEVTSAEGQGTTIVVKLPLTSTDD
ncbi:MAG: ATP-binding protein [bacterium]